MRGQKKQSRQKKLPTHRDEGKSENKITERKWYSRGAGVIDLKS